jgi:Ca2+-binding RTX toxin-like protein
MSLGCRVGQETIGAVVGIDLLTVGRVAISVINKNASALPWMGRMALPEPFGTPLTLFDVRAGRADRDDNHLSGGAGDDHIAGKGGRDRLLGAPGFDVLNEGTGTDECDAGTGGGTTFRCE